VCGEVGVCVCVSITFSWNTKQLRRAVACSAVRSLKSPLNTISVRSSSSALQDRDKTHTHRHTHTHTHMHKDSPTFLLTQKALRSVRTNLERFCWITEKVCYYTLIHIHTHTL